MNLSAITMAMNVSNANSDIGVAVLGKNLDTLEQAGAGIQKIMESAVNPNLGQNIDYSV